MNVSKLVRLLTTGGMLTLAAACGGNEAPIANAGADQAVVVAAEVSLDGSASSDADDDPMTYKWSIASSPEGSSAALDDATAEKPTFTADLAGVYEIELVVDDGDDASPADSVSITASEGEGNAKPVAAAGDDATVALSIEATLDGSASSDADDGDTLSYAWTITSAPADSTASLTDADKANATLTPDLAGDYVLELIVNDGTEDSDADSITLTAVANSQPVAAAGDDASIAVDSEATLDGSASSDADDGDTLTYAWTITSAPASSTAALVDADTAAAKITPDLAGDYVLQLVVDDGLQSSEPDTVTITATE